MKKAFSAGSFRQSQKLLLERGILLKISMAILQNCFSKHSVDSRESVIVLPLIITRLIFYGFLFLIFMDSIIPSQVLLT